MNEFISLIRRAVGVFGGGEGGGGDSMIIGYARTVITGRGDTTDTNLTTRVNSTFRCVL